MAGFPIKSLNCPGKLQAPRSPPILCSFPMATEATATSTAATTSTKKTSVKKGKSASGPKEKKPLNRYLKYVSEQMPIFKQQNPDMKVTELMTLIAAKWKTDPSNPKCAK